MTSDLDFLTKFHSFTFEHNPHKAYYLSVEGYIKDLDNVEDLGDQLTECMENDELWTLQIYPITPISFYWFGAPTLDKLLEIAKEALKDEKGV